MNIRFEYLYRDAGNFKQWGEVIFSNDKNHTAHTLAQQAGSILIDGKFFIAKKAGVLNLYFNKYIESLDHGWHEFHLFETINVKVNDPLDRDIEDFMLALNYASKF